MAASNDTPTDGFVDGARILDGIRVLDLAPCMAGSICTMFLADHGAEVIAVEPPGGSTARRSGAHRTWARGKRSIVLDVDDSAALATLHHLAEGADIVVEALGVGRAAELGVGYDTLAATNAGLIYCTITGDGSDSDEPHLDHDILAAARFGVMAESPGHRDGPIFPGHPAHAYGTAFVATVGVLASLRASLVTGVGDRVDVSYRDGILSQLMMNWWSEREVSYIQSKTRTGRLDFGRRRLLLERYECADGEIVQVHTGAAGAFARAMDVLGLSGEITPAEGVETASELTASDLEILRVKVPEIMRTATSTEWTERFWANEVACLPVRAPGRVFTDEQLEHSGLITGTTDPELGTIRVVGSPIAFSKSPARAGARAATIDEDGDDVRRYGWMARGLERRPAGDAPVDGASLGRPLDGVEIVELSNWFASPSGNRLLGDLGAAVIKVEPLSGDSIRPLPNPHDGANGGKRGVAIDLKDPASRPVIEGLLRRADVLQHNMRPGAAERLAIDEATVRSRNESIIYAYGPGYGSSGPKARLQSFAPLLSGFVGVMHLAAGDGNEPHGSFGNEDYYAGLLSATGILLALVHRERTAIGQYVETPQLHASTFATSEHYLIGDEIQSSLPALDSTQSGYRAGYRVYQCLIGWLCVACQNDEQAAAFADAVLGGDPGAVSDDELVARFTNELYGRTADDWKALLAKAGVPCEVVREDAFLHEYLLDDRNIETGRAVELDHPLHGRVRVIGELVHLRNRPWTGRRRAPLLGEHTTEVLSELGLTAGEIAELIANGVAKESGVTQG